jgi:hypothetical protein
LKKREREPLVPAQALRNASDTQELAVTGLTSPTARNVTPADGAKIRGEVNISTESVLKLSSAENGQTSLFVKGQDITPNAGNSRPSDVCFKVCGLRGIPNSPDSPMKHSNPRWTFGGVSEILNEPLDVQKTSSPVVMDPAEPNVTILLPLFFFFSSIFAFRSLRKVRGDWVDLFRVLR